MTERDRIVAWIAGFAAPACLCGKRHPCPDHGRWAGSDYRPSYQRPVTPRPVPDVGFALLRSLADVDRERELDRNKEVI